MVTIITQILSILGIIIASIMFFYARKRMVEANETMDKVQEKWKTVKRETENERREAQLKIKDEIYRKRIEFEAEVKKERLELERLQSKIADKYEALEKKEEQLTRGKTATGQPSEPVDTKPVKPEIAGSY